MIQYWQRIFWKNSTLNTKLVTELYSSTRFFALLNDSILPFRRTMQEILRMTEKHHLERQICKT